MQKEVLPFAVIETVGFSFTTTVNWFEFAVHPLLLLAVTLYVPEVITSCVEPAAPLLLQTNSEVASEEVAFKVSIEPSQIEVEPVAETVAVIALFIAEE